MTRRSGGQTDGRTLNSHIITKVKEGVRTVQNNEDHWPTLINLYHCLQPDGSHRASSLSGRENSRLIEVCRLGVFILSHVFNGLFNLFFFFFNQWKVDHGYTQWEQTHRYCWTCRFDDDTTLVGKTRTSSASAHNKIIKSISQCVKHSNIKIN